MSNSGLIDIHVLEETASRVSGLTKSITKQVSVVEEVSLNARRALGPTSGQNTNLEHFRDNAAAVLNVYGKLEKTAKQVQSIERRISEGPAKLGWQEYVTVVAKAYELSSEWSLSADLKRFPQIPNATKQLAMMGSSKLETYVKKLAILVFVPLDGERFLGSDEQVTQFAPEDIAALSTLVNGIDRTPGIPSEVTNEAVAGAMDNYMSKSMTSALAKVQSSPSVQAYKALCESGKAVMVNALQLLFGTNPQKLQDLLAVANRLTQQQIDKVNFINDSDKATNNATSRANPMHPISPDIPGSAASASRGSKPVSTEALKGPRISRDSQGQSQMRSSPHGSPAPNTLPALNTASAIASGPGGGPASGTVGSPATIASNGPGSAISSGGGNTGASWAAFEQIELARNNQISPEDLAKSKREGLATLVQVFVDIETQCRKAPITSEFGVSGASLQYMKTLQNISSSSHGVEVVLSEVATRAYLAKPLAPWAAKSEPGPAARADPLSLYFSDSVTCLHSILHQIASEQLKDVTKTGIFMLSNLSAVEHYITNSNTETLSSIGAKTELMKNMGEVALQKFQQLMELSFKEYLSDWSKLAPHLMESTITGSGAANVKLSSKDRDIVKEKFRLFNSEFEALVERQKKYQVADPILRMRMSQEVNKLIKPLYTRFYLKHKDGDFTKNVAKYVKYTPEQFEQAVAF